MNYNEFLKTAEQTAKNFYPDAEVSIRDVEKLQGESYRGLSIRPKEQITAVSMDLRGLYVKVQNDPEKLTAIMAEFLTKLEGAMENSRQLDTGRLKNYESMKDHLVMQLVPAGRNAEKLKDMPHRTIGDVAVVYRVIVGESQNQNASALITNQFMERYGINPEQLHRDAMDSQAEHRPPELRNMAEVMMGLTGGSMGGPEPLPMWVASVKGGVHGAVSVLFPDFMDQAAEKLGGDFFVLPSSIHECLFVRDDGEFTREGLQDMVRGVNRTEVSEADFLSDNVYHYDSIDRIFEKAETFEARTTDRENAPAFASVREGAAAYEAQSTPEVDGQGKNEHTEQPETDTITVLLVEPEKYPRAVEIGNTLEALQKAVDGPIETAYPFDENVCFIMNEEGKLEGLPLNRAIRDDEGKVLDIVAGSFLVAGLAEDNFSSLTPDQLNKYEQTFHQPEAFVKMGRSYMVLPMPDELVSGRSDRGMDRSTEKPDMKRGTRKENGTKVKKAPHKEER